MSDLTTKFKEDVLCESRLEKLKRKLNGCVQDEIGGEAVYDRVPASATVTKCIIYYVAGFLCKKLLKRHGLPNVQDWTNVHSDN